MDLLENYLGFLNQFSTDMTIPLSALALLVIGYTGAPFFVWSALALFLLIGFAAPMELIIAAAAVSVLFLVVPLRRALVSSMVMKVIKGVLPAISETEKVALEAGVVWAESDLFSGKPNFGNLMKEPYPELTAEEKAFLNGPCDELCEMIND